MDFPKGEQVMMASRDHSEILVVDDNPRNLKLLVTMLDQQGYIVRPVNNGKNALLTIQASPPDLILLDIRMPDLDGFEVCEILKEDPATQDIPVIFISAQHGIEEKLQAFHVGGLDYITKPFQLEEVLARVNTQLNILDLRRKDEERIESLNQEIMRRERAETSLKEYQEKLEDLVVDRTTALEQALDQERKTRDQLIHADRLTTMGRISASVAHEINNPMQSVLGCLGLAEEAVDESRDPSKYFKVAKDAIRRVTETLNQMRKLYQPSEATRTYQDIKSVLKNVLALTEKQLSERNVAVTLDLDVEVQPIWMVPDQISQVFLNLILNALDAMPNGGRLHININTNTDSSGGINIEFTDTGVGISEENLPNVFEPFYTTKEEGSGLGMAISFSIIQQHGGNMEVDSQPGHGSTFRIWLPTTLRERREEDGLDPYSDR
jgi:signal transduction histidine kinase